MKESGLKLKKNNWYFLGNNGYGFPIFGQFIRMKKNKKIPIFKLKYKKREIEYNSVRSPEPMKEYRKRNLYL